MNITMSMYNSQNSNPAVSRWGNNNYSRMAAGIFRSLAPPDQ